MRIPFNACPLCESKALVHERTGDCSKHPLYKPILPAQINWKKCTSCEHVFTDGYFTPQTNQVIFADVVAHQKPGYDIERQRAISARMVEKVLPYVNSGRWLDVGFGNGSLLFTAHEYGFVPVGTDLRQDSVNMLKSLGIEAYCSDLEALALAQSCSVVSMADVLEHMPFPKKGLAAARNLMTDDGVLLIAMPNSESIIWAALNNSGNPYWSELEHYHNFGRSRLYALLSEMGFEPIRYGISERYIACMEVVARKKP
jgi:2-polyprenyl-3-methyl-5-hydroxy-6-metoxy-1,4-benzoquinol methylase